MRNSWAYLERYLARCQRVMLLDRWTVTVSRELIPQPEGETIWADIATTPEAMRATLRTGQPFWDGSRGDKRATIAHELGHCHTDRLHYLIQRIAQPMMRGKQWTALDGAFVPELESVTETMAQIIAPYLPAWTGPKGK